jgi:hypothetical protein
MLDLDDVVEHIARYWLAVNHAPTSQAHF